ncbi:hypothetical protein ACHAWF_008168 [Thalassiosira exigua]
MNTTAKAGELVPGLGKGSIDAKNAESVVKSQNDVQQEDESPSQTSTQLSLRGSAHPAGEAKAKFRLDYSSDAAKDIRRMENGLPVNLPYGEVEDLSEGKSCVYKESRPRGKNHWSCRKCSPENGCKPIQRRGRCKPFPRYLDGQGQVPRVYTSFSPFTSQKSTMRVLHHDGHTAYAQEYPICDAWLSLPCFDLTRCKSSLDGALRIYSHGGTVGEYIEFTTKQHPGLVQKVDDPNDACLFVVSEGSYDRPQDMRNSRLWNHGKNHYIHSSDRLFGTHHDRPFNDKTSFGMAAVATSNMDDAWIREGYDVPLIYYPIWKRPDNFEQLDLHRPRRFLLSFKGDINPGTQRSWQHRWIASEYWYAEPDDVHVDTKCQNSSSVVQNYVNTQPEDYSNLLLDSTFLFCPGGGGINSFRFAEVLLAGAIPVVTSDFLTPFHPDVDWSGCVVRVSDARVIDAPRIVRRISAEEVIDRQKTCARLVDASFGKVHGLIRKHMFFVSMGIWRARIQSALEQKSRIESLISPIH